MYKLDSEEGFKTGLRIWILFIAIFTLLRFPAVLSIGLGAIAAFAAGVVAAFWKADPISEETPPETGKAENPLRQMGRFARRIRFPGQGRNVPNLLSREPKRRIGKKRR
jgi:hypothetical protein